MRVLIVSPHPDDESIGMGATILKMIDAGDTVHVLYLTDGDAGIPGMEGPEAGRIRHQEALQALTALGVMTATFTFGGPDGRLLTRFDDAVDFVTRVLENGLDFEEVYTTHEEEAHQDHRAAALIVKAALARIPEDRRPRAWGFEVWTPLARPSRLEPFGEMTAEMKRIAIRRHESQIALQAFDRAALGLNQFRGAMLARSEYAEAFASLQEDRMNITVCLFTYAPSVDHARAGYARDTLQHALAFLTARNHDLTWHIADDGSDPAHVETLVNILEAHGQHPTYTNAERGGYGRSYNLATQALHAAGRDAILCLEDDWQLTGPLDLAQMAGALNDPDARWGGRTPIGCIRMGYLGFTEALVGTLRHAGGMTFLYFEPASPETHIFAGHPRLETVEWQRAVGPWPEGLPQGETELAVAHREAARRGVAWPLDLKIPASPDFGSLWAHIGSEQA